LALGIFITRIGCSLINDHQGAITSLPWAILWPDGTPRHPVAEYLALNGLIMFLIFWFLRIRLKKPGQLFIIFLFWYTISRFLLDFTRATDTVLADPHYFGLFISQWLSLFVIAGLFFFLIKKRLT
jgi:phosphatidylglycerol:prolipoprotein diacylglycerol transferase